MTKNEVCDCCDTGPVERKLTLTDRDGVLLDIVKFCDNCYQDREIFITGKTIEY